MERMQFTQGILFVERNILADTRFHSSLEIICIAYVGNGFTFFAECQSVVPPHCYEKLTAGIPNIAILFWPFLLPETDGNE